MKIVAVTGGGQGIGRAIAWHFARKCYAASITDSDREAGLEALETMKEMGVEALFMLADVSKPPDVTRWMNATVRELAVPTCWSTMPAS